MGDPSAGKTAYDNSCASCHGSDPAANVMKVANASTVAALESAIAKVGSMNGLSSLSAQQKLDIAAYIASVAK